MRGLVAAALLLAIDATPASAHSAARGFVLLLPTGYAIAGAALAVLATLAVVTLLDRGIRGRKIAFHSAAVSPLPSLVSATLLAALVYIGFAGPRDPAENLLPLVIWTLWWVILVLLHPVLGNFWRVINPFTGVHDMLNRLTHGGLERPLLRLPPGLWYYPALAVFAAFAWFQLIDPAPYDPPRLALAVALYAALTMLAVIVFGPAAWLARGDPFAIFLTQLGAAAPLGKNRLVLPGAGLLSLDPLPVAGTLFVLLTLSCISFDGFANTFAWLSLTGFNPLDFPGRTAMLTANTIGLAGAFLVLTSVFAVSVTAGWLWAGRPGRLKPLLGRLALSLVPISVVYHFAHYLSDTLLSIQYLAIALNDPFAAGTNILGLGHFHATASFQNSSGGALMLFAAQTVAIAAGHAVAVAVAHAMAVEAAPSRLAAFKLEAPLAVLMIVYTVFGLWLLSTPAIS
jgi:hypothetical protein